MMAWRRHAPIFGPCVSNAAVGKTSVVASRPWLPRKRIGSIYKQFVRDGAPLNTGFAAAISGGPLSALKKALSKHSNDCQNEGQTAHYSSTGSEIRLYC
jgi:hypothetical protein